MQNWIFLIQSNMHNALGTSQKAITKVSPKCRNCIHYKLNQWRHVRHYLHLWQLTAFTDWASKNLHIATWTVHLADRWAILWTKFWMDRIWHYMCSWIQAIITLISLTSCTCNPCALWNHTRHTVYKTTCDLCISLNSPIVQPIMTVLDTLPGTISYGI